MERLACWAAAGFASPVALAGFPVACAAWMLAGGSVDVLTLVLSVLAITMTQLVLAAQQRGDRALHAKLDGLIHGTQADDALAGIEQA